MKKLLSFVLAAVAAAGMWAQTIAVLGFESDSFNYIIKDGKKQYRLNFAKTDFAVSSLNTP